MKMDKYRNPEKFGLVGWRKTRNRAWRALSWLGSALFVLMVVAMPILLAFVIAHFVRKNW